MYPFPIWVICTFYVNPLDRGLVGMDPEYGQNLGQRCGERRRLDGQNQHISNILDTSRFYCRGKSYQYIGILILVYLPLPTNELVFVHSYTSILMLAQRLLHDHGRGPTIAEPPGELAALRVRHLEQWWSTRKHKQRCLERH